MHGSHMTPPPQKERSIIVPEKVKRKKTKQERIKAEILRLKRIFKDLSDKEKKVNEGLIGRAATLLVLIEDLEADILENGTVELFSQSENQIPYERARPTVQQFNSMQTNYQKVMKQLSDFIEKSPAKVVDDGFGDFVERKNS